MPNEIALEMEGAVVLGRKHEAWERDCEQLHSPLYRRISDFQKSTSSPTKDNKHCLCASLCKSGYERREKPSEVSKAKAAGWGFHTLHSPEWHVPFLAPVPGSAFLPLHHQWLLTPLWQWCLCGELDTYEHTVGENSGFPQCQKKSCALVADQQDNCSHHVNCSLVYRLPFCVLALSKLLFLYLSHALKMCSSSGFAHTVESAGSWNSVGYLVSCHCVISCKKKNLGKLNL